MKGNLKYKILLGSTFLIFILFEILKPKPTDWNVTLSPNDKIPFGTYVFRDLLEDLFPASQLTISENSIYQILKEEENSNLIIVSKIFEPSDEDLNSLVESINNGAECLLISEGSSVGVRDTFDIAFNHNYFSTDQLQARIDSLEIRFNGKYYEVPTSFISSTLGNDNEAEILSRTSESDVFFIEKKIGKGKLYVCSAPLLVTNFTLLSGENASLLEGLIAKLPDKKTTWASLYTSGRFEPQTSIRYLLTQPALRWAYAVGMITLLLFMIFKTKREQRQIPTIKPPKNTSIEFAETVGQLYLKFGNHQDIVDKKIRYLKEYFKSKYLLNVTFQNEEIEKVANKTGKEVDSISTLFFAVQQLNHLKYVDKNQLIHFNKKLEEFYINQNHE